MRSDLACVSTNHRNADVALRDLCALTPNEVVQAESLAEARLELGIEEAAVLSTCNRTEFYLLTSRPEEAQRRVLDCYAAVKNVSLDDSWTPELKFGQEAATHLMAVSSGMDSLILGEDQILSQVRDVHQRLLSVGASRPILTRLFLDAVRAGKKVRTDTRLCEGAVSVGQAAVDLARKVYSKLERARVLIIGAGETGSRVAGYFRDHGATRIRIANRTVDRAARVAREIGGEAIGLPDVPAALRDTDIVLCATASIDPVVRRTEVESARRKRHGEPLVILDIANPRNVEPSVGDLSGVFLFNIDHLEQVIDDNLARRRAELPTASTIAERFARTFDEWRKSLHVKPTIMRLAEHFHAARRDELERVRGRLSAEEFDRLDRATDSLVRKLLHNPILNLKHMANGERLDRHLLRAVWDLHGLTPEATPDPTAPPGPADPSHEPDEGRP